MPVNFIACTSPSLTAADKYLAGIELPAIIYPFHYGYTSLLFRQQSIKKGGSL
jgi:hypothetical protein